MGYYQTDWKTNTGKTLKRWPVLVDHQMMAELEFSTGQKFGVLTEPGQLIVRLAKEGELTGYKVKSQPRGLGTVVI